MRTFFFIALSITLISGTVVDRGKWVIDSSSKLLIHGSTNIKNFTCSIGCLSYPDTLEYINNTQSCELVFYKNKMSVPVKSFSCGNDFITRDFQETLQAKKYPEMSFRFISLEKFSDSGMVTGRVEINVAGVTKRYSISYYAKRISDSSFELNGTHCVCFSDFKLTAPKKLMGLIQVQDNLTVEFQVIIQVAS